MTARTAHKSLKDRKRAGDEPLGAEGRPLREYVGWDDAAGVFRQDDPALRPKFQPRRTTSTKPDRARK